MDRIRSPSDRIEGLHNDDIMKEWEYEQERILSLVKESLGGLSLLESSSEDSQCEIPFDEYSVASSQNKSTVSGSSKPFDEYSIASSTNKNKDTEKNERKLQENRHSEPTTKTEFRGPVESREDVQLSVREPMEKEVSIDVPYSIVEHNSEIPKSPSSFGPLLYEKIHRHENVALNLKGTVPFSSTMSTVTSESTDSFEHFNVKAVSSADQSTVMSEKDTLVHSVTPCSTGLKEKPSSSVDTEDDAIEHMQKFSLTISESNKSVQSTTVENDKPSTSSRASQSFCVSPRGLPDKALATVSIQYDDQQETQRQQHFAKHKRIQINKTQSEDWSVQRREIFRKTIELTEKERKLQECYSTIRALREQQQSKAAKQSSQPSHENEYVHQLSSKERQELLMLRQELSRKTAEVLEKEQKLQQCNSIVRKLTKQSGTQNQSSLEEAKKYHELQQAYAKLEAKNRELEDEIQMNDNYDLKYQILESKYEELQESYSKLEQEAKKSISPYSDYDKLEMKYFALESRHKELKSKCWQMELHNRELLGERNAKEMIQYNYQIKQKQYDELKEVYSRLESQHSQLQEKEHTTGAIKQDYQFLEDQCAELQVRCSKLEEENRQLSEANEMLGPGLRDLNTQHDELKDRCMVLEKLLSDDKEVKEKLEQRCRTLEIKYLELQSSIAELEDNHNKLLDEKELLFAQNENLRRHLKTQSEVISKRLDDVSKDELYKMGARSIKLLQLAQGQNSITASWSHEINLSSSSTESESNQREEASDSDNDQTYNWLSSAHASINIVPNGEDAHLLPLSPSEDDLLGYFEKLEIGLNSKSSSESNGTRCNQEDSTCPEYGLSEAQEKSPFPSSNTDHISLDDGMDEKETVSSSCQNLHFNIAPQKSAQLSQGTPPSSRPPLSPRPPFASSPQTINSPRCHDKQFCIPSDGRDKATSSHQFDSKVDRSEDFPRMDHHFPETKENPQTIGTSPIIAQEPIGDDGLETTTAGEENQTEVPSIFDREPLSPATSKTSDFLDSPPPQERQLLILEKSTTVRKKNARACECFMPLEFDPPENQDDDEHVEGAQNNDSNSIIDDKNDGITTSVSASRSAAKGLHCVGTNCGIHALREAINEQLPGSCTSSHTLSLTAPHAGPFVIHSEEPIAFNRTVTTTTPLGNAEASFDSVNSGKQSSSSSGSPKLFEGSRSLLAKRGKLRRKQQGPQGLSASGSNSSGGSLGFEKATPRQNNRTKSMPPSTSDGAGSFTF